MSKYLRSLSTAAASLLIYLTVVSVTSAAEYGYHPSTPFRLGAGLNPSDPLEAYPVCFDHEIEPVPGTSGSSLFRLTLLESRRDFLREMSLSASMSGQYKFFSGGASVALDEGYSFSSDSLTWTVYLTLILDGKRSRTRPQMLFRKRCWMLASTKSLLLDVAQSLSFKNDVQL